MPFLSPTLLVKALWNLWLLVEEDTRQNLSYEPKCLALGGQAWHIYLTLQSWGQQWEEAQAPVSVS